MKELNILFSDRPKMDEFEISDFLENFNKETRRGSCKLCHTLVQWSRMHVAQHKRSNCAAASVEEKLKFAKRKTSFSAHSDSLESDKSTADCTNCNLTQEEKSSIDGKFADFFFRTGISFRVADSAAFKDLMSSVNPTYATKMPTAKQLKGSLLDKAYAKVSKRIEEILGQSSNLTLISDGWTNVRGEHIVNFCIKAPGMKTVFYSSIDTSGISQDAAAVADAICSVLEKLGPQNFCCVVTDNANVMKASWDIIEEKYPHISANGCAAHAMNLLVKDILGLEDNARVVKEAESIIKFVTHHHIVKGKYEEKRKSANIPHTLTMPVSTRWYSRFNSMRDLMASQYILSQLVDENGDTFKDIKPRVVSQAAMDLIKSNDFWRNLGGVLKIIEFPVNIIGESKTETKSLSTFFL